MQRKLAPWVIVGVLAGAITVAALVVAKDSNETACEDFDPQTWKESKLGPVRETQARILARCTILEGSSPRAVITKLGTPYSRYPGSWSWVFEADSFGDNQLLIVRFKGGVVTSVSVGRS